jgi:hypothetical protein
MRRRGMPTASMALVATALAAIVSHATPTAQVGAGDAKARRQATAGPLAAVPVEVHSRVSRTAAWVGDRVTYIVEVRCAPGVDVLVDDLAKEALRIEGGQIVAADAERADNGGRTTHRMRYTLATYRVDATEMLIPAIPVRYFARGAGPPAANLTPAGQVLVPPLRIAIRSTVPETRGAITLRAPEGLRAAPWWLRVAQPVGVGLILVAFVPVVIWSLDLVRRARDAGARYRARRTRSQQRGSFDEIRSLAPSSDATRVDAYGQLDAFLKNHLHFTTGLEAHALTPPEIERAIAQRAPGLPHEAIGTLLAACERARYDVGAPTAADWADAVRTAEQVVNATPR